MNTAPFAHPTGGTLTVNGIEWLYLRYNGKVGFKYGTHHAIVFNKDWNMYAVMQDGCCQFVGSVSECLDCASDIVFDFHANRIIPFWEMN